MENSFCYKKESFMAFSYFKGFIFAKIPELIDCTKLLSLTLKICLKYFDLAEQLIEFSHHFMDDFIHVFIWFI